MRAGAVQIPHQSRQCGEGRETRSPVRLDGRGCRAVGQVGAHRRELGKPGPGAVGRAHGRKQPPVIALGCQAGDVRSADFVGDRFRRARGSHRFAGRADHPFLQGERCSGFDRGVPRTGKPLHLCLASGLDRGRDGNQGNGRFHGRAVGIAAGGDWRHDSHITDSATGRKSYPGSGGRVRNPSGARIAALCTQCHRLPWLWPHHQHDISRAGKGHRRFPARAHAGVEKILSRCRIAQGGGHGLYCQRAGREQACRYWYQPAWNG